MFAAVAGPAAAEPLDVLRRGGRAALAGLLFIIGSFGCGPGIEERRRADPRPNILLISLDTTRADHLSAYGYPRPTSPRLERLAAEGVRFETAYAPTATTGPTHASLFTGLYPITHAVRKNGVALTPEHRTLAEVLSQAGYETGGIVSSYVLSRRFGFAQGFDDWNQDFSEATAPEGVIEWEGRRIEGKFYGSAEDTTRRALAWLDDREHPEQPFLLFVHYFDPHDPYFPPPGFRPDFDPGPGAALKKVRLEFLYDVLLAFTDLHVGALLDGLESRGLEEDTLVVVFGDHGEGLLDHGHDYHGAQIYEEAVLVPLIARWPGHLPAAVVDTGPIALVDLAPTLLELVEVGPTAGPRQEIWENSRADRLRGNRALEDEAEGDPIFLYRRHYEPADLGNNVTVAGEQYGIRIGRFKLIEAPEEGTVELFDLEADPHEREDLSAQRPEVVARLSQAIARWRSTHERASTAPMEVDTEARAHLEALGYVE